jgi:spore maturation protein SpmB
MSFLIGVLGALAAAGIAAWIGMERRSFYTTALIVIASYYVLFAVMAGSRSALVVELAVMMGFVAIAKVGFARSTWLIVAALAGHGLFDFFHARLIANPGVPVWWPAFCGSYDVAAAGALAWIIKQRQPAVETLILPSRATPL